MSRRQLPPRYLVIMAGGQGTRFWPRSRRSRPKHLLAISGRHTLLQDTARRLAPLFSWRRMLIVTNHAHAEEVRNQLPRIPADQILVEPASRSTAPCAALATEWILARDPEAVMAVVPADHVIADGAALRRTLEAACDFAARNDALVTIGIKPRRAETGYGYVELGDRIARQSPAMHWVRRFHEKPTAAAARRYLAGGRHLWNSGMFVWRASTFRSALNQWLPEVGRRLSGVWSGDGSATAHERVSRAYRRLRSVSVDVGVLQPLATARGRSPRLAVLPADFGWSDVGSWIAMPEVWGCDQAGNATVGKVLRVRTKNAIVYSPERLVALVGVQDLIVVDSPDALLVCARDHAQEVRKVTDELRRRGWSRYL